MLRQLKLFLFVVAMATGASSAAWADSVAKLERDIKIAETTIEKCKNNVEFIGTVIKNWQAIIDKAGGDVDDADRERIEEEIEKLKARQKKVEKCLADYKRTLERLKKDLEAARQGAVDESQQRANEREREKAAAQLEAIATQLNFLEAEGIDVDALLDAHLKELEEVRRGLGR